MKHVLLCAIFITFFFPISAYAKYIPTMDFGIKFGGNFDNMNGNGWSNSYHTGYNGGLFLGFRENVFSVQGEALVSSGQFTHNPGTDVKNMYVQVPVLFGVRLVPRLWLQLGPQYSLLASSKFADNSSATNYFKTGSFSGVAGVQLFLPLHLLIGARYIIGVTDCNNVSGSSDVWKQRTLQLYLGLKLI